MTGIAISVGSGQSESLVLSETNRKKPRLHSCKRGFLRLVS